MTFALATILFAGLFLVLLLLLHFLKPEFDPSWRMISEYEIGKFGWMMRLAFLCWGAALFSLLLTIWPALRSVSGAISRVWFLLIVLALIGAALFKTDPITDQTSSATNKLHQLCGSIVILTFPIAATIAAHSLSLNPAWAGARVVLLLTTVLTWLSMFAFFATIAIATKRDPNAGKNGPHIPMGWPNRIMVLVYVTWLIEIALLSLRF